MRWVLKLIVNFFNNERIKFFFLLFWAQIVRIMVRNRSRSGSRSKDKKHHKHHKSQKSSHKKSRSRSRSRSPRVSQRSRSRSPRVSKHRKQASPPISKSSLESLTLGGGLTLGNVKPKTLVPVSSNTFVDPQLLEGKTSEEIEMMKLLGFSSFDTTKGKHVDGSCNAGAANIQEKRRYRQYMNRKGGFNRPLDPIA